jgi:SAM-dependent methyltransferase
MEAPGMQGVPEERVSWLERLVPHVRPGRIVEFGCGSGFVLEFLSQRFSDSVIVGVDRDLERLESVLQRRLPNVAPVRAAIARCAFRDAEFDTVLFVGSLHEVFSVAGADGVKRALIMARDVLKADGALLVQDFLRPSPRPVELAFRSEGTRERFFRFAREFRPRRIQYRAAEGGVRLDITDAVEFISKYRSPTEEDWQEEMGETHFALTEEDFTRIAESAGFRLQESVFLPRGFEWLSEVSEDLDLGFHADYGWIQLAFGRQGP